VDDCTSCMSGYRTYQASQGQCKANFLVLQAYIGAAQLHVQAYCTSGAVFLHSVLD
jgi:hypothetical protein